MENHGKNHGIVFLNFCGNPGMVNSLHPGQFFMIYLLVCWFFQINFFKKIFQEYHLVSNRLDPDQAWYSFGHHLGPICLQSLSADNTRVIEVISKANIKFLPADFLSSDFFLNQFLGLSIVNTIRVSMNICIIIYMVILPSLIWSQTVYWSILQMTKVATSM